MQMTKAAAQELKRLKEMAQQAQPGVIPRLTYGEAEGEMKLVLDIPKDGDEAIYYADDKVLVVDAETSEALTDITLNCRKTPQGLTLVLEHPGPESESAFP